MKYLGHNNSALLLGCRNIQRQYTKEQVLLFVEYNRECIRCGIGLAAANWDRNRDLGGRGPPAPQRKLQFWIFIRTHLILIVGSYFKFLSIPCRLNKTHLFGHIPPMRLQFAPFGLLYAWFWAKQWRHCVCPRRSWWGKEADKMTGSLVELGR